MEQPSQGRIIAGRFQLEQKLGRGGYGAVYRATQLSVERDVALKLVHPHLETNEEVRQRFAREARLASRLRHPNIVRVIDFGDAEGELFLVMEFLPGPTLKARMRSAPMSVTEALSIGIGVARGLEAAHAAGLVHRDLKPSNVILLDTPEGARPVVIDFGLVKAIADRADDGLTRSNVLVGTPAYVSPEAVVGDSPDHRSDLYALGVLLYEMISGEKPVNGSTALETATAHLRGDIVPLDRRCEVPADVAECIHRLLARAPEDRPAGAGVAASELQAALEALRRPSHEEPSEVSQSMTPTVPTRFDGNLDATIVPNRGPAALPSGDSQRLADLILPLPEAAPIARRRPAPLRPLLIAAALVSALMLAWWSWSARDAGVAPTANVQALSSTASLVAVEAASTAAPALAAAPLAPALAHARTALDDALGAADLERRVWQQVAAIGDAQGVVRSALVAALAVPRPTARTAPRATRRRITAPRQAPATPPPPQQEAAPGTASINVAPYGQVWIDGQPYGDAPVVEVTLSAGEHRVETRYADARRTERIVIRPGEHLSITHRFEIPP